MQDKKVIFTNEFDVSVLDTDFYLTLLKNIQKLQEEKSEK